MAHHTTYDVVVIKRSHQLVKRRDWAQGLSKASREQDMRYSEHLTLISATLVFHTLRFRWHRRGGGMRSSSQQLVEHIPHPTRADPPVDISS